MRNDVQRALDVLTVWSEGFALTFVFADDAACVGIDATVLSWGAGASVDQVVEDVLAQTNATQPVVVDFRGCAPSLIQDALRRLNERRSLIERLQEPILLVCPLALRLPAQYAAPDLWHIRTMVPESPD